jgi:hypothetical protein
MTSQDFIIHLQRTIGNQAVQRLMRSKGRNAVIKNGIQAKLKLSQPGDMYEQEANRVAEQVMRKSSTDSAVSTISLREDDRIDRKCATCELEEDKERLIPNISRKQSNASNLEGPEEVANEISNLRSGGGLPLDTSTKEFMEYRFGHDFSNVKIHTDERATRTAASVNALAYTAGNDIVFGRGEYKPSTVEGRRKLAHELTHVIQQNGDSILQSQRVYGTIQRLGWGDIAKVVSPSLGLVGDLISDSEGLGRIYDPLSTVFDGVVLTNKMGASQISIPKTWFDTIKDFSAANKDDGNRLLAALSRAPSFYDGGWILDIQQGAAAMTLDRSIFVSGKLSLSTFVHELVHVGQYGKLGKTAFLVSYFGLSAATIAYRLIKKLPLNPMESSPHEMQAYDLEARFRSWYMKDPKYNTDPHHIYA